jgi:quinol monooxygenase YgiN
MPVWTHGIWRVRPGKEDAFVAAFDRLVRDVGAELGSDSRPTLLRDREQPNVFVTFGPWEDEAAIERFRRVLGPRLGPVQELLERFEPATLDQVWPE